jgi:hypothetical protein
MPLPPFVDAAYLSNIMELELLIIQTKSIDASIHCCRPGLESHRRTPRPRIRDSACSGLGFGLHFPIYLMLFHGYVLYITTSAKIINSVISSHISISNSIAGVCAALGHSLPSLLSVIDKRSDWLVQYRPVLLRTSQ